MIQSISIANIATFHPTDAQVLSDLRKFNYIFGSNGTGKTTISRVVADPAFGADCACTWQNGAPLECLVLNRDFVEKNFDQLRGVFTLGEKAKDTEKQIIAAKEDHDKEVEKRNNLTHTLQGDDGNGGTRGELERLESDYRDKFWAPIEKIKRDKKLDRALMGVLSDKEKCKQKILQESQGNRAELKDLTDLETRAKTIFGESPTKQSAYPTINGSAILAHESNPILTKKVIGKEDVDIAAMITKLGNSDWVRQGLPFYDQNNGACPFCQQGTTEQFAQSLKGYFDEAFEQDTNSINTLVSEYTKHAAAIQATLDEIVVAPSKFIDVEKLKTEKVALDKIIEANKLRLENKKKEPSQVVTLDSVDTALVAIKAMIDAANTEVEKHNKMVANLATEKQTLTAEVWRYVLNELKVDLEQYVKNKHVLDKAIAGLETKIKECKQTIEDKKRDIRELEKQTTSTQPTISAVNGTLKRFGFDSFTLSDAGDGKHYKIIRANGDDARRTLSEGEKTFVVFLYFYHLLKGSFSDSGMTTDRVVVFDDPVSSLDSDVLFIVSSIIKEVCEDCRSGAGNIKQVFVLTHNVHFHKEVTYNNKRPSDRVLNEESFWIVRKGGGHSKLDRHNQNPIKTSYELLWMEIREAQASLQNGGAVSHRIENTLRRILEHYFTILGSIDRDDICAKFTGQDKCVCKSLFSWVNAGSHSALDDAHLTPSNEMTKNSLTVFRAIFDKTDHLAHYKMMMRDAFVEANDVESTARPAEAAFTDDALQAGASASA